MPRTEDENKEYLEKVLASSFSLLPEVWMTCDGKRVRIDYLAKSLTDGPIPWFGIEVKADYDNLTAVFDAIRQSVDYRHAIVTDDRAKSARGKVPPFVFLFPSSLAWGGKVMADAKLLFPEEVHRVSEPMAKGAEWLAWRWNVGGIRERLFDGHHEVALCGANDVLWSSVAGWAEDAKQVGTNRGPGNRG